MFSLMCVWWIFFVNWENTIDPLTRYFQYPMSISLEWSLGLFLYLMGNGTDCIAGQPRTHVYLQHPKRNNQSFLWNPPKTSTEYPICTHLNPMCNQFHNQPKRGGWRVWRCKIWICFLACKPLIENITCNPHRGRKTERDGQEWEAYIDHHSLTHTDR